jgi:hypothetical protein
MRNMLAVYALLLALLSGCASIRLEGVIPYDAEHFQSRVVSKNSAWDAQGMAKGSYVLQPSDEIELRLEVVDGTPPPLMLNHSDTQLLLLHDIDSIRVGIGLLRSLQKIDLTAAGQPLTIDTNWPLDATWQTVSAAFTNQELDCGNTKCRVLATLRPNPLIRVGPGDGIDVVRTYVAISAACEDAKTITSDAFHAVVDAEGFLALPLLPAINGRFSEVASQGDLLPIGTDKVAIPGFRRVGAQIEDAYGRVRVWAPDWSYDQWPSLTEVGECLAVATLLPQQAGCPPDRELENGTQLPKNFVDRCRRIGVGSQFRVCPATAGSVHYRLAPPRGIWTLVDRKGNRVVVSYRHGMTVAAGVREQYRRLRGHELVLRGLFDHDAFLAVVPDALAANHTPFYVHVSHGRRLDDDPLLQPGDTVFIGRTRPERIAPEFDRGEP